MAPYFYFLPTVTHSQDYLAEQHTMSNTNNYDQAAPSVLATMDDCIAMDPHHVLGVAENARPALIKAAFADLAAKYHPIHYVNPAHTHEILLDQSAALQAVDLNDLVYASDQGPTGYLFAGWATPSIEPVRRGYDQWQAIVTRWNEIQWAYWALSKERGEGKLNIPRRGALPISSSIS
ncbi:uncharacterized protein CLAFUR5_00914 [Fulvia fulva]|uniref:J domain-containing protein n=1 Tax=Passalora fulva TaxID=5499 RepID=A0A9Q8P3D9_PASFU|nr:uncharacterized protein CLAFUR5_00914 [Fulvia fulva]KAK4637240.1 hypothetical protein CLAFUR0_00912 [Fulvia fulva]UJO11656.1 hypothetical protein CLAFUR5_00914 [Fulvia fulva]